MTAPFVVPPAVLAVALATLLDLLVAEFPERAHPVAAFGRAVGAVDRAWARPRLVGALAALALPLAASGVAGAVVAAGGRLDPLLGAAVAGVVLFSTTSLRMLLAVAGEVVALTEADLPAARSRARALVGRDADDLSAAEVRSAAVESAAENLADGLVAPLLAFAAAAHLSLPAAAAAATWVKAVNTMDSMLGYPGTPVGAASARLDDAAMWVPARLSAALLAAAAGDPAALLRARQWAGAPDSPNSGWPMATLAAALGVRLEKPGAYRLNPRGALPSVAQARRGVRVVGVAGLLAIVGAGVVSWS
ncbi:MAG: adenosylcobinamide-phosphate synthase CbiB [Halobacteriaceae archaeon]